MMKILVTGGCGYVGSVLVPRLLNEGNNVLVIDDQWFGNFLLSHPELNVRKKSINQIDDADLNGIEAVIHLANVANDPSVELNPTFSWEVNVLHTTQFLELCKRSKTVKKFIFASSGSVYGVKSEPNVTEELSLVPISAYNKTKMSAERVCLSYGEHFDVTCVRPATVCGVSPRMRFDVVVNMFVLQAFTKNKITVLGGDQVRPNIHIADMVSVYTHFLSKNGLGSGIYNAGFENISVMDIAKMVQDVFKVEVEVKPSNDPRSYRQDSTKLLDTGFVQMKSVSDAINEISTKLKNGEINDDDRWHTVKWMTSQKIGLL
jgi:nucleoside-diphosphate-sugar epimerase